MPIEIQIEKQHGKNIPASACRHCPAPTPPCRSSARNRISSAWACSGLGSSLQDHGLPDRGRRNPRARQDHAAGFLYRGLKRSTGASTATPRWRRRSRIRGPVDFAIDVGFPFAEPDRIAKAFWLEKLPEGPGHIVIWTTSRGRSANQALNVHPDFGYSLVQTERGMLILATVSSRAASPDTAEGTRRLGECEGHRLAFIKFAHRSTTGSRRVFREYVTLDTGTGIVHSAPAYGIEDFMSCRAHGMPYDKILMPVLGMGASRTRCRFSAA